MLSETGRRASTLCGPALKDSPFRQRSSPTFVA